MKFDAFFFLAATSRIESHVHMDAPRSRLIVCELDLQKKLLSIDGIFCYTEFFALHPDFITQNSFPLYDVLNVDDGMIILTVHDLYALCVFGWRFSRLISENGRYGA